jgi:flagellar biosynthesis chaperone FliJ
VVLKKENDQLKVHKSLMEKEIDELKAELDRISGEKEKYYEILLKVKNSFYQSNVMSQIRSVQQKGSLDG